ncbi:oligosaccharide flippase family protein [Stutzerimonas stutzeri]|uniref:oligosaccharide flippase family protein n=1 Tax=Stutzerimonas stutzeri TaxID=316 RepID=UPI0022DD72D6|nr:oligosaccharide flippase family protein [Stutzerimonas stutzeri]WBL59218.1 oligosaccharide flippase family protein [Stutzerimonas stutzeri]
MISCLPQMLDGAAQISFEILLKRLIQHRLFRNTAALLVMQVFTYAAPFVALPYLTRVLGMEGFGLLIAMLSLLVMANVITDYGFNLSATYIISRKRDKKPQVSRIISSVYQIKAALFIVSAIGTSLYLHLTTPLSSTAQIAIYATIFFQTYTSPWLFQGIEKMRLITYFTIASRCTYILLVFLTVKHTDDYDIALTCNAFAAGIAFAISNILIVREGYKLKNPPLKLTKYIFKNSSNFFLSRITLQATSSISVLLLSYSADAGQVGLFGAAQKLFQALVGIIQPINQALYPYLAKTKDLELFIKFVVAIALAMILPTAIGIIFAEHILTIAFGRDFAAAAGTLKIYLVTGYVGVITILMGYPAFATIERIELANKSVIIASSVQVAALIALYTAQQVSPVNVAISILFTEIITLTLRSVWFYKYTRPSSLKI